MTTRYSLLGRRGMPLLTQDSIDVAGASKRRSKWRSCRSSSPNSAASFRCVFLTERLLQSA